MPAQVGVVVNADTVVAAGGDTILSPDNVGVSGDYLMVQEDGIDSTRPTMAPRTATAASGGSRSPERPGRPG
jgi:hypothetical protein